MNSELMLTTIVKKQRNRYSAWCPELDIASEGDSIDEAQKNLKEAVQCQVEAMIEAGDLNTLLEKIGITKEDLKKHKISETFSGTFEVPILV